MTLSMYDISVPVFDRALANLSHVLRKGEAFAKQKGVEPDRLLQQRLIFDMFPLLKQIQIACDTAVRNAARLADREPASFPDTETTYADALDRIERTRAYLATLPRADIDASAERTIRFRTRGRDVALDARSFLFNYALPNLMFHCTTAYDILRVAGTDVGKPDFLGEL